MYRATNEHLQVPLTSRELSGAPNFPGSGPQGLSLLQKHESGSDLQTKWFDESLLCLELIHTVSALALGLYSQ